MFKLEDIVEIHDMGTKECEGFRISINTNGTLNWEEFRHLVQSLAKIGVLYQPNPTQTPDPKPTPEAA